MYDDERERVARLLYKYPALKDFGFSEDGYIMVDTVDDLVRLSKAINEELVINTQRDPVIIKINDSLFF
jgi:hypothetical protein